MADCAVLKRCSLRAVVSSAYFYYASCFGSFIFFVRSICICGSCKKPYFNFFTFMSNACIFCCYFGFTLRFFSRFGSFYFISFFSNVSIKYAFHKFVANCLLGDFSFSFFILLKLLDFDRSFFSMSPLSNFISILSAVLLLAV